MVDVKTLELVAAKLKEDAGRGYNLNASAMSSIAGIIEQAIGAPLNWPSRVAGTQAADTIYDGSPSMRLAFNTGVKWAVEHYGPSIEIRYR